ncbi:MAG: histidinol-phosphate transaminase, partial [Deferribacterota bacterium]|nr:histidinol-phosphate transaminase [Deferribacterota bacterium]
MYNRLVREDVLSIEPYKPGLSTSEVIDLYGLNKVIKMASNENPLGTPKKSKDAIVKFLDNLHIYPLGDARYLRRAISDKFNIDQDEIVFGNGSDDLIEIILLTFLRSGEHALSISPSFSEYYLISKIVGSFCKKVRLSASFEYDFDRIIQHIEKNTKIIFLANPNNPTGTYFNESALITFLGRVDKDKIIVLDEAYREFAEASDFPKSLDLLANFKNLIIMRTFSKAYGLAGLRVGYGITSKEIADLLNRVRQPFNVNSLAQVAAIAALDDKEHLEATYNNNIEGKYYLYSELNKLGYRYIKSEANFILIDVKDGKRVFENLLKEG